MVWVPPSNMGYESYDRATPGDREAWLQAIVYDSVQALLWLHPDTVGIDEIQKAYETGGWFVVRADFSGIDSLEKAHDHLKPLLNWPEWTTPTWHVFDDFITDLDDLSDNQKSCLLIDARTCHEGEWCRTIIETILNNVRNYRQSFGKQFAQANPSNRIFAAVWYGPGTSLGHFTGKFREGVVLRPIVRPPGTR